LSKPLTRFSISAKWLGPVGIVSFAQEDAMAFFAAADATCNFRNNSICELLGLINRSKKPGRHSVSPMDCGEQSRQ
jgi:hypothetical protein